VSVDATTFSWVFGGRAGAPATTTGVCVCVCKCLSLWFFRRFSQRLHSHTVRDIQTHHAQTHGDPTRPACVTLIHHDTILQPSPSATSMWPDTMDWFRVYRQSSDGRCRRAANGIHPSAAGKGPACQGGGRGPCRENMMQPLFGYDLKNGCPLWSETSPKHRCTAKIPQHPTTPPVQTDKIACLHTEKSEKERDRQAQRRAARL
jgi:hypothetical protein